MRKPTKGPLNTNWVDDCVGAFELSQGIVRVSVPKQFATQLQSYFVTPVQPFLATGAVCVWLKDITKNKQRAYIRKQCRELATLLLLPFEDYTRK